MNKEINAESSEPLKRRRDANDFLRQLEEADTAYLIRQGYYPEKIQGHTHDSKIYHPKPEDFMEDSPVETSPPPKQRKKRI